MISFDQWEKDCLESQREFAKECLIEKLDREPTNDEIDDEVVRMSEDAHELAFHKYHCA